MADGMFDSGGDWGSDSGSYRGGGVGVLVEVPLWAWCIILAALLGFWYWTETVRVAELARERELDRTVYAKSARTNFEVWSELRDEVIVPGTFWLEEGSSHQKNYHCKGGQYQTLLTTVTFCCSVERGDRPLCRVIQP